MPIIEEIGKRKIIAVIRLNDLAHAIQLTQALIAGGVTIRMGYGRICCQSISCKRFGGNPQLNSR